MWEEFNILEALYRTGYIVVPFPAVFGSLTFTTFMRIPPIGILVAAIDNVDLLYWSPTDLEQLIAELGTQDNRVQRIIDLIGSLLVNTDSIPLNRREELRDDLVQAL